ncbi:MAG: nucleotidyltransferase family protein [Gemmatimonadaceae bacterium]
MDRLAPAIEADAEANLVFRLAGETRSGSSLDFRGITDWRRLLQLASDENALIALRDAVRSYGPSGIPLHLERQLAIFALDRECRMRRLKNRLVEAVAALHRAGIEVLLLKGAALAHTLYGSFVARPMGDIDLLVKPERSGEARTIMLTLGWGADPELPGDDTYENHHHLPPLRDLEHSALRLEIHRSLLPPGHPFGYTEQEIWAAARQVTVGSVPAFVMHPSHHAVHVAIHFAWSHMLKLGAWNAFRDLATLSATGVLDWNEFARLATRWGASSCSYWTLCLGRALSGLTAPAEVMNQLCPALPEFVRRPLGRHFIRILARAEPACPSARLDQLLWSLAMQPHREGHARVRPWCVSLDLVSAINEKVRLAEGGGSESTYRQVRRSGRYITEILA